MSFISIHNLSVFCISVTYMSSNGEMKISLKLIIYSDNASMTPLPHVSFFLRVPLTFSCIKAFNNFNSRYVLFANTGAEKGFMIFLIATFIPVSWSLEELLWSVSSKHALPRQMTLCTKLNQRRPCQQVVNQRIYMQSWWASGANTIEHEQI